MFNTGNRTANRKAIEIEILEEVLSHQDVVILIVTIEKIDTLTDDMEDHPGSKTIKDGKDSTIGRGKHLKINLV